jgi:hypothetical protein
MSKMYGKRRVVLEQQLTHRFNRRVVVCGSEGQGGLYFPIGCWYEEGGLFYADLKSREQWYDCVNKEDLGVKRAGGTRTKQALRECVMEYWRTQREAK